MAQKFLPSYELESDLVSRGAQWIVGFDEVGRGCLAGPVMVGATLFSARQIGSDIPYGLRYSKLLTEKKRESLVKPTQQWTSGWSVGEASNREIDEWGITHCLGIAALRALKRLEIEYLASDSQSYSTAQPHQLSDFAAILDGPHDYISPALGTFGAPEISVFPSIVTQVKGDQKCATVAGASVIAKVYRDHTMVKLAEENPQWDMYEWKKNKGYGSVAHREALKKYGATPYHRISWNLGIWI